jgi:ABC-2 type transport system ATP-binding protein
MADEVVIRVENVSKDFVLPHARAATIKSLFTGLARGFRKNKETQHALKDISFEIKKGEFFGIVGRNGSGKSTLLKILAGIYQPTSGRVQTIGKLVPFIELGVGFNPELTGRENVYLNGAMLGFSKKEVDTMYEDIVSFAELKRFMDQKLKNYSSGMQVRLAFSMAIRAKADILLVDEVLAVGDASFQRKCYEYFQQVKAEGVTVIFVTHDMSAVRQYCDRAALIDMTKLVEINDPEAVAKEYIQLFADNNQSVKPSKRAKRWGDKKATFSNVRTELVDDKQNVLLSMTVEAKEDILDPVYGFMVSNQARQPILGSNTRIEQVKSKPLKSGQQLKLSWKFPNIFNEGKFLVELALIYSSQTQVSDWWENASSFRVTNEKVTPYIVNPATKFSSE